jgi:hypothetical protein
MIWHSKRDGDAGLQWLRGIVRAVVEAEMSETSKATASAKKHRGRTGS